MTANKCLNAACGWLIAFVLSFACTACIASAFLLTDNALVDLTALAYWCALFSLICCVCFSWRLGLIIPFAMILTAVLLWRYSTLELSLKALCNTLTSIYHKGYGWPELFKDVEGIAFADRTMALQAVATVIAASASWTICKKRLAVWAVVGVVLPFVSCAFVLKTVPDEIYLFLLIFGLLLLLLTQSTRRSKLKDANRLTLMLLLPCALAVFLLYLFVPRETYNGRDFADNVLVKIQTYLGIEEEVQQVQIARSSNVDLSQVGRQSLPRIPVMDLYVSDPHGYYLRGRSYDIYDLTSWSDSGTDSSLPWRDYQTNAETVTITTRMVEDLLYVPYYIDSEQMQQIGNVTYNDNGALSYSYLIRQPSMLNIVNENFIYSESEMLRVTALPESTKIWAQELWENEISADDLSVLSAEQKVGLLNQYLTTVNVKEYSLNTPRMSSTYDDFAQWFLYESETGYCVHFATAATVLLRAAGVPARYVTGYYTEAETTDKTVIYEKDAHAWVEYWTSTEGWNIFDPTPSSREDDSQGSSSSEPDTLPPTTEPESTKPPETTKEPTQPTTQPVSTEESALTSSQGDKDLTAVYNILKWCGIILLSVLLLIGQAKLRVKLKTRARKHGSHNERAIKAWHQIQRYAKLLDIKPEPELLAMKAKFSNHIITLEELRRFEAVIVLYANKLKKAPWYCQIWYRIVLALY